MREWPAWVWTRRHPQNWDSVTILIPATVENNSFKFGTQLGVGEKLTETTTETEIVGF